MIVAAGTLIRRMSLAQVALMVGLSFELVGLVLIFVEAGRIRRRELGEKTRLQKVVDEIRNTLNNAAPQTMAVGGTGPITVTAGGANVTRVPTDDLEAFSGFILEHIRDNQIRVDERFARLQKELAEQVRRLQETIDEMKASQRTAVIRAIRTERVGSGLVLVGLLVQGIVSVAQAG